MYQGQPLANSNPNSNYASYFARKTFEGRLPDPSKIINASSHIYVVDSRERNRTLYPNPALYGVKFPDLFKNVTSIELKGTVLPKTEYNVHSQNNVIIYNVQDFITSVVIQNPGYGYVDGVYGFGAVPPNDLLATVSQPAIASGTQAEITVTVNNNRITSIVIANPGSGYLRGHYGSSLNYPSEGFYSNAGAFFQNNIPFDRTISNPDRANIQINVGNELAAFLNEGQYDFAHPNDSAPGLCREVTRALQQATQEAIDNGIITPVVGGPLTGAQYFPYSVLDSNDGSCFLFTPNPNASENSNVAIQRGSDDGTYEQSLFLELLWGTSNYQDSNAMSVLGYGSKYINPSLTNSPLDQTSGALGDLVNPWSSTPIESLHNYNLNGFPKYCIITFGQTPNDNTDRIEALNTTLDRAFATLIFDANAPDVIFREPSTAAPVEGEGNSNYTTLVQKPGTLKGIKGADFDTKILSFGPAPIKELKGMFIRFQKYNGDLYDFKGQDHLLIFQINANDINTGNRA